MTCPPSSSLGLLLLLIAGAAAGKTGHGDTCPYMKNLKNTHLLSCLVFVVLTHIRVGVFFLIVWQEVVLDASTFSGLLTLVRCGVLGSEALLDPESSGSLMMQSLVIVLGL